MSYLNMRKEAETENSEIALEVFSNAIVVINELVLRDMPGDKEGYLNRLGVIAGVNIISKREGTLAAQGPWKKIIEFEDVFRKSLGNSKTGPKNITRTQVNPFFYCECSNGCTEEKHTLDFPKYSNHVKSASRQVHTSNVDNSKSLIISENPCKEIPQIAEIPVSNLSAKEEGIDKRNARKGNEIYVNITLSSNNSFSFTTNECNLEHENTKLDDFSSKKDAISVINENVKDRINKKCIKNADKLSESDRRKVYEQQTPYKFFCTLCSFKSKRESHYKKHLQLHKKGATKLFVCVQCGFRTIRMGHLRRHELQHSSQALQCSWCPYTTDCSTFLQRHHRIKHSSSLNKSFGEKYLRCPHCDYLTSNSNLFKRHMKIHGIGKDTNKNLLISYDCDKCNYKTQRKEHFDRHQRDVHSGLRPFLCDACGKAFKRADALRQHRAARHQPLITKDGKIISGSCLSMNSVFCCPHCSKLCRSRAHLRDHLATHSDERSFLCEICGSSFKTRAVQRKHVTTVHANPKAFPCHKCVRRFSTKYALLRHLKIHGLGRDGETKLSTESGSAVMNPIEVRPQENYHIIQSIESSALLMENESEKVSESQLSICPKRIEVESHKMPSKLPSQQLVTVMPILHRIEHSKDSTNGVIVDMTEDLSSLNGVTLTRTPAPSETTTALLYLTHDFIQY